MSGIDETSIEKTPWILRVLGKPAWRRWVPLANVGGDFSYWEYFTNPNCEEAEAIPTNKGEK